MFQKRPLAAARRPILGATHIARLPQWLPWGTSRAWQEGHEAGVLGVASRCTLEEINNCVLKVTVNYTIEVATVPLLGAILVPTYSVNRYIVKVKRIPLITFCWCRF